MPFLAKLFGHCPCGNAATDSGRRLPPQMAATPQLRESKVGNRVPQTTLFGKTCSAVEDWPEGLGSFVETVQIPNGVLSGHTFEVHIKHTNIGLDVTRRLVCPNNCVAGMSVQVFVNPKYRMVTLVSERPSTNTETKAEAEAEADIGFNHPTLGMD